MGRTELSAQRGLESSVHISWRLINQAFLMVLRWEMVCVPCGHEILHPQEVQTARSTHPWKAKSTLTYSTNPIMGGGGIGYKSRDLKEMKTINIRREIVVVSIPLLLRKLTRKPEKTGARELSQWSGRPAGHGLGLKFQA